MNIEEAIGCSIDRRSGPHEFDWDAVEALETVASRICRLRTRIKDLQTVVGELSAIAHHRPPSTKEDLLAMAETMKAVIEDLK